MSDAAASDFQRKQTLYVHTFGCQMNEYDSEKIVRLLSSDYEQVSAPEQADLVVVNSCSVREKGEQKLFSLLGELRDVKEKSRPGLIIGVAGCVAQQEGRKIVGRNAGVDFVVGTHNISLIPSLIARIRQGQGRQIAVDFRDEWEELPEEFDSFPDSGGGVPARALIAIQRGCAKNCSFCVVPTTRGPEVSRSPEEILREVRIKCASGAREVVLLGQTVNSYGRDLNPRWPFEKLVRGIAEIDGVKRIRFTSPHPAEVRPSFVELFGDVPQLCKHIHLPLQSGSDAILKRMNRNYRLKRYMEIVAMLRERCPGMAISTDIIVGFPTETEADFEQTLSVVRDVRYHSAFAFKYSTRPNTAAAGEYREQDQIPSAVAQERLARLLEIQEGISEEINAETVGTVAEVLVDGISNHITSFSRGRIEQNTLVEFEGQGRKGLVNIRIEHASAYGLRGSLVNGTGERC